MDATLLVRHVAHVINDSTALHQLLMSEVVSGGRHAIDAQRLDILIRSAAIIGMECQRLAVL